MEHIQYPLLLSAATVKTAATAAATVKTAATTTVKTAATTTAKVTATAAILNHSRTAHLFGE